MNCDRVQLALSARMDGEPVGDDLLIDDLEEHVAGCPRCRAFRSTAERVRTSVRIRPAEPVPDLVARIVDELETVEPAHAPARPPAWTPRGGRWRRAMPAAALVAGAVIGSVLVGGPFRTRGPEAISAQAVVRGVRGASPRLDSFDGSFRVVERGLAPDVPVRRLDVRVAFLAPQRFRLDVVDRTAYPSASWIPSDVTYIENAATTFRSGPTGCPAGLPAGGCPTTRTTVTSGSTPGDLMVPVTTFASTRGIRVLGGGRVDGREVVRVELAFARAAPMLPFLWVDDSWRPFFRSDRVEVALDAESWLPRRIAVFPVDSEARRAWELRFGLPAEDPETPILEVTAASVTTGAPDGSRFRIPGGRHDELSVTDLADRIGYQPATPTFTADLVLASAIAPSAGGAGPRSVIVYADGLDYLRLSERHGPLAPGSALGSVGPHPERVVLPGGAIASYAPAGPGEARRLAIHAGGTSLFLESNLPVQELFAIAGSIPLPARPAS